MTRRRRILANLLTAVAGAAVALLLVELCLRLGGFSFALYPTEVQFGWPDPVTLKSEYVLDRDLLWVRRDYEARLGVWRGGEGPRAVFLGDSCTEGDPTLEVAEYDVRLAEMLAARRPGSAFTSLNAGTGGWSTYQGLQQLRRDIAPLRPRLVSIYFGWNDHWKSFGIEDKEIGRFNLDHSLLALKLSQLRSVQLFNKYILLRRTKIEGRRLPPRVSLDDFQANLREMVRLCRERDIVPLLLTAPSSHGEGNLPPYLASRWLNDLDELVPLHQRYVQAVRAVAGETGAPLVDLAAEFERMPVEQVRREYFSHDGIHPTAEGYRMIAGFILGVLEEQGLVKILAE